MTRHHLKDAVAGFKQLLGKDEDFIREGLRAYLHDVLESEMTAALGASKGERTERRVGYPSGYYSRTLVTRVGPLEHLHWRRTDHTDLADVAQAKHLIRCVPSRAGRDDDAAPPSQPFPARPRARWGRTSFGMSTCSWPSGPRHWSSSP